MNSEDKTDLLLQSLGRLIFHNRAAIVGAMCVRYADDRKCSHTDKPALMFVLRLLPQVIPSHGASLGPGTTTGPASWLVPTTDTTTMIRCRSLIVTGWWVATTLSLIILPLTQSGTHSSTSLYAIWLAPIMLGAMLPAIL